jgi:hypothetical protein
VGDPDLPVFVDHAVVDRCDSPIPDRPGSDPVHNAQVRQLEIRTRDTWQRITVIALHNGQK